MACPTGARVTVADLICNVTSEPEGPFDDWPNNIKDTIWHALEGLNRVVKEQGRVAVFQLVYADVGTDPDTHVAFIAIKAGAYELLQ